MDQFIFHVPTKIIFGKNSENSVGSELKTMNVKKVLVHYGSQSALKSGLIDRITASLKESGIASVLLGGVVPNPRLEMVYEGIGLGKAENVDFILAVGGGSVIDSSKAIALGLANPDLDVWDDIFVRHTPHKPAFPVGAVLTIAASGSESSNNSVIMNEKAGIKMGYANPTIVPKIAFLNPELTYTLPPYQTASGIVDILMHSLERYFYDNRVNYLTDKLGESVMKTVIRFGPLCIVNPENYEARSEVMWAGNLSHNSITGLGNVGGFICHPMQHEVSAMFDVTHGANLAVLWLAWAKYVYERDLERFAQYAVHVWDVDPNTDQKTAAIEGIRKTEAFFRKLKMPVNNEELGIGTLSETQISHMAEHVTAGGKKTLGARIKLDVRDIINIYRLTNG